MNLVCQTFSVADVDKKRNGFICVIVFSIKLPYDGKLKGNVTLKINSKRETLVYFYFGNHLFSSNN